MTRIISANLNGIRSARTKGFFDWMNQSQADVVCVQEIKAHLADLGPEHLQPGMYKGYFQAAEKKGYSGVGLYCKVEPLNVIYGLNNTEFDAEGRMVTAEFENMIVSSIYFPSGSSSEERQEAKFRFLDHFEQVFDEFESKRKPVILCGDWNIAHKEIDLKNWKGNLKNSGFTPEERAWIGAVIEKRGWVDAYRVLYPEETEGCYTWWSNRGQAYAKNVGWRIDYQMVSPALREKIQEVSVYKAQKFSDHAPLIADYDHPL
ncbi:MAG: DNA-(apurinic or apyrimidinic site) lyase [Limnobacter sp. CACIAM 66H1]|uniref:exodeoxyribonuclease III n=1 Tax=Limnobacter sp. CACIAM 66H1 TaxID=1813033 RepID=UPI0007A8FD56|nr:exodeoxyribonuclease III [Limnobacter sp. CACIAM 66H1]KYP10620.1 MAG: DNA-(apurinic or apyrimidinic site) lyase [Limnobacter sp. CACIAM 66H1]